MDSRTQYQYPDCIKPHRSEAAAHIRFVVMILASAYALILPNTAHAQVKTQQSGFTSQGTWRPSMRASVHQVSSGAAVSTTASPSVLQQLPAKVEPSQPAKQNSDEHNESAANLKSPEPMFQPLDVEAVLQGNPLQHDGPWLESSTGMLPVESLSGPAGGNPDNIDPYDDLNGFELFEKDDDGRSFSLQIGGRTQIRYTNFHDRSIFQNPGANDFDVSRTRLGFRGHVFERFLRYNIALDIAPADAKLANGFAEVNLQDSVGLGFGNSTRLRYGYWRTNFGRQAAESSQNMQFVERSLTSNVFNLGTNTGIAVLGSFTNFYRPVNYEVALTNGFGTFGASGRDELDSNFGVAMRFTEELFGEYTSGESDNDLSQYAAVRVGASGAYTRRTRRGVNGSASEFDNSPAFLLVSDPTNDTAVFSMDQLNGVEQEYDIWLGGLEFDCKHAGWSLHSEYLFRWINNVEFTSPDTFKDFTHGFYVQGGYFLTEKVEIVARQSTVYATGSGSGSPVGTDYQSTSNESGGGINFYFRRHFSKLQLDVFHYDGAPINSSAMNLNAGDEGVMYRIQYQLAF